MSNYLIQSLEDNARSAKRQNSFYDYKEGSATAEYNSYINGADQIASKAISKLKAFNASPDRIQKVTYLLERYKAKKLEWMNDININRARVPSVMICGPANFPVRAKEKQNNRDDTLRRNNPDYILDKIRSMGNNSATIYSDDKNAVEKIKQKIEMLKTQPDKYGNRSAEIRRLKGRLLQLDPDSFKDDMDKTTVNGVNTYDDILKLWDAGKLHKSNYGREDWYYDLFLDFYNGKRHYKMWFQVQLDEAGEHLCRYNLDKREMELIPLTDELKYKYMIGQISGSGNKAIMYKHLKSLMPQEEQPETTGADITINGESVEVVRNNDITRLQLIFEGKPEADTRAKLKSNGFRWAPSQMAWQRLLNSNSESALRAITD